MKTTTNTQPNPGRNVAAIHRLADFIASARFDFDMADPHVHVLPEARCGAAGCIGGHAALLFPEVANNHGPATDTTKGPVCIAFDRNALAAELGIDHATVSLLCFPDFEDNITRAEAVTALRQLADEGEVDWESISPKWKAARDAEVRREDGYPE